MGLRGIKYISIAVLALAAIAIGVSLLTRSAGKNTLTKKDEDFIDVFVEMSLAREMAGNDIDSLDKSYAGIFQRYDVDSSWLFDYVSVISKDAEKQRLVWEAILARLDSLRKYPETGSG